MIHAGDYTGAKVFRRVDSQAIVTFVVGGMIKPSSRTSSAKGSENEFNLLQTYRQYLSDLVMYLQYVKNSMLISDCFRDTKFGGNLEPKRLIVFNR
jgi:hypothetical protein